MACCVCGADDAAEGWQRWDSHPARKDWDVLKDLGAGAWSQVVLARHKTSGDLAALKVVFLESPAVADDPEHLHLLQRESDLLGLVEHPNVVELRDVYRSPRQLVLVLEWLRGGQVIDKLHELGLQYSEQQAAAIFAQAAAAVAHLHEYGVLHRDIKPENLMFAQPPGEAKQATVTAAQLQAGAPLVAAPLRVPAVKLVDLGMACLYDPAKPVTGPLGSPGFVAPEVVRGAPHTPAMDVFSLGTLLFVMLVGRKPFNIRESESLRYAFMSLGEAPGTKDPRWLDLSPDAKHLLMGMLAFDPARRLTMPQVLAHEWLATRGGALPRPLGRDVVHGAATVASVRRLRHLCGGVAAFNRVAAAAAAGGDAKGAAAAKQASVADSAKDVYLKRLRQSQRLDPSFRGGGAVHRLAASLASSAYARAHDTGGSIHPKDDVSVRRGGRGSSAATSVDGSVAGAQRPPRRRSAAPLGGGSVRGGDPSTSRRLRFASALPGGLVKSPTTVMLSEMERRGSVEASQRGGGGQQASPPPRQQQGAGLEEGGGELQRRPSTLQLLAAAAKVYVDSSRHGARGGGAGGHSASSLQAAASGSVAAASAGALRQVADDGGASRQRLPRGGHLPGAADASSASSLTSASSAALEGVEGRRRGGGAAAAASGLSPPRSAAGSGSARCRPAASGSLGGSRAASGRLLEGVDGLLPQRVVQRRSLENPMAGGAGGGGDGRSWAEMQAQLRQGTPRSSTASREGSRASGTPSTRVVRLKPLQ